MGTSLPTVPQTDAAVMGGVDNQQLPLEGDKQYFGRFSERDLVDQIGRKWEEWDTRLRDYFAVSLECFDQYRNKQDFSDKEDWQSRVTIPKAHAAVKQGVANIRKLFIQARNPVLVEDTSGANAMFAPYVQEGVRKVWETSGFLGATSEALEAGLIMGLIAVRGDWQYRDILQATPILGPDGIPTVTLRPVKEGYLNLRAIDPWRLRWGPETGSRKIDGIIEEQEVGVPTLRKLGFAVPESILKEDIKANEADTRDRRRKDENEVRGAFERRCQLREYWGPLVDESTQEVVVENAHVVIGNKKAVLLAEENQLWRKKPPYVLASPNRLAFRFPGQGILEVNRAIKANIDKIAQMATDHFAFSTLVMLEADMSALENPEDLATGVEPGKLFRKRPGAGGIQAIRQIPINPVQGDVFNMLIALDKEFQRGTFITENVQGLIDAKGETTATEVSTSLAQSTIMLASIARDLEEQYIEPLADMTWDYMFQFMDVNSSPNWTKILGPAGQRLDMLPRAQRISMIQGNYEFKARGISLQVERQAELQKLINYLTVIGQFAPQFVPLLNMPVIFKRIHESFSFPMPDEMLAPNAQQIFPMMQQNLLDSSSPSEEFAATAGSELIRALGQQAVNQSKPKSSKER